MVELHGKRCLVTGATRGIGRVTARELAHLGAEVIVVGRSETRAKETVDEIQRAVSGARVTYLVADLSSQAAIHALSDDFHRRYDRLDVLVNNAGAIFMSRKMSVDQIEMTLALNHLAYFLLTHLLMDTLLAAPAARVVNVSSAAHYAGRIDFNNLQCRGLYFGWVQYANSKLANVLFSYALAERLRGTHVTSNALHPGLVASGFGFNNGPLSSLWFLLMKPFSISNEQGAQTSIYLASSPEVEGVSGKYFDNCRSVGSAPASYDVATAQRLWEVSEMMTGTPPPNPLPDFREGE